jgi:hypothetical protein
MSNDLQTLLRPLREVEPTSDEVARVRAAIDDRPATAVSRRFRLPPVGRRRLAVLAATSLAIAVAVAALPAGDDDSLRGALRAAAAAAAEAPAAGAPFTGYRHIVERVREDVSGAKPREYRRELWIDAKWRGAERIDEGGGTPPETSPLAEIAGPFGRAPLAKLPTDPDALLRTLKAAQDDGSFAVPGGGLAESQKRDADVRRAELSVATAQLIAESNATPELRAAGFGVLERLGGAKDLGTVRDAEGREGRGLEITWGGTLPEGDRWRSALRLIFDTEKGEVLSRRLSGNVGDERYAFETTYLSAEQTRSLPRDA